MSDYSELKRLAEAAKLHANDSYALPSSLAFERTANPAVVLALIAENERLDANVRWQALAHEQVGIIDQLKAEVEALAAKYEAARDRKNSITAMNLEIEKLKADLVTFKGGISALGDASKKLAFYARVTLQKASTEQDMLDACDAVEGAFSLAGVSQAIDYIEGLKSEVEALRKDAERYRWFRNQHWDCSVICAVVDPKLTTRLGAYCPSGKLLDDAIDAGLNISKEADK